MNENVIPLGKRWAFIKGPKVPNCLISTHSTLTKKFWRFYRIGPGVSRATILQLVALQAANEAKRS